MSTRKQERKWSKKKSIVLENFPQTDLSTTINHFSQLPKLFYTWIQNELCFILAPKANDGTISFWRKWKIYEQLFITLYIECDRLEKKCVFFVSKKRKIGKLKHMKFLTLYRIFCSFWFNGVLFDGFFFSRNSRPCFEANIDSNHTKDSIGLWR